MKITKYIILCLLSSFLLISTQADAPKFVLQFGGGCWTQDSNPIDTWPPNSIYSVVGSINTTLSRWNIMTASNDTNQNWTPIESDMSDTVMYLRENLYKKWEGILYLKVRVIERVVFSDGYLNFIIVLSERSRDDSKGIVYFTGTWQILSGTGPCAGWGGFGTTEVRGTYVKYPGRLNPEGFTFPMKWSSDFQEGLRLTGTLIQPVE